MGLEPSEASLATIDADGRIDASTALDLASSSLALARRFTAGATLWCWSPAWPEHAAHVAVEFVHPVVMGARALPAAVVDGPDPIGSLRSVVEPGDVLLAVGTAADDLITEAMLRAQAWGAETLWLGAGQQRPATAGDHLVWFAGDAGERARDGTFILAYHVLWELTHVCFEHPGLVAVDDACEGPVCVTCSDEGRVGEVVDGGEAGAARVRCGGRPEEVDATLVGPVDPGDLLLVHAGVAISRLEPGS